jgi:shikimate dehydrogenase
MKARGHKLRSQCYIAQSMSTPIDAHTQVCAIFGHPVGHSLSPAIHNAAFAELGLNYVYIAHDVAPPDLLNAMRGILALKYRGLSITIPHKVSALSLVDELDETAFRIGCINTVINEAGVLKGRNSDGLGALAALRSAQVDPKGLQAVMLGSGGAARAIAVTLVAEAPPRRLTLLGVDQPELMALATTLREQGKTDIVVGELNPRALQMALKDAQLLLHTTPVGMAPNSEQSVVPVELLHSQLTVFDAVYTPRQTRLLRDAAARGCRTIEGFEMFLGQALVQFELWTGQPAPREVMRSVIEKGLG